MSSEKTLIPKLNDRDVIRAFRTIAEKHGQTPYFGDQMGRLEPSEVNYFEELGGLRLNSAVIDLNSARYVWKRLRDQSPTGSDSFEVSFNEQQGRPSRLELAEVSTDLLTTLSRPLASVKKSGQVDIANKHRDVVSALESVTAKLIVDNADFSRDLQDSYLKKEQSLTERFDALREADLQRAEAERLRVESEQQARSSELDDRQKELNDLKKSLDDRNNTHVRREIRENLLAMTKDRLDNFAISKQTKYQHFLVTATALLGLSLLISAAIYYGSYLVPTSTLTNAAFYTMIAKSSVFAASAIALGYWYLGWQNRWLQRIADAEFKLQQFRLDIERASWLAETVLEWKQSSKEQIPELLVSRLSAGLFQAEQSEFEDPKSPASHLAEALLNASSTAKIKIGDQELILDRKGIRNLSKEG